MRQLTDYFRGTVVLEIASAAPERCLTSMTNANIQLLGVRQISDFVMQITLYCGELNRATYLLDRQNQTWKISKRWGMGWTFRGLKKRPVLWLGMLLILGACLALPNFILFYKVEGNTRIPTAYILRELDEIGIGFGYPVASVKPQQIKDVMLNRIPELAWMTVNCNGCVATISVVERLETEPMIDRKSIVDMVASRDGVITQMEVYSGAPVCKPGDAVMEGDIMVSAYIQLENSVQVSYARAEVYALTHYDLTLKIPDTYIQKVDKGPKTVKRSLIIGKNRINLSGGTGIPNGTCGKMIIETPLELPGGYCFPVTYVTETYTPYTQHVTELTQDEAQTLLEEFGTRQVKNNMIAGKVLASNMELTHQEGTYCMNAVFSCREMIARPRRTQVIKEELS